MLSKHLLKEQRPHQLTRLLNLLLRDRSHIRHVRQHEQHRDEEKTDSPSVAHGADGVVAADLGEDVECVAPADEGEVGFDECGGEGVPVVRAAGPWVGEIRKWVLNARESG